MSDREKRGIQSWQIVSFSLITISLGLMLIKIIFYNYSLEDVIPDKGYRLVLEINTDNKNPRSVNIMTFAPVNNVKQRVTHEEGISEKYHFRLHKSAENRLMDWSGSRVSGQHKMKYIAKIRSSNVKYQFTPETVVDTKVPVSLKKYLGSTGYIQTDSKLIIKKLKELTRDKATVYEKIQAIHHFVTKKISYKNFSGGLDSLSTLQLMEASCNGKSRLFVAMARNLGLPARLVGGIILNKSPKKTTHQWLEIYINEKWVPFCPTNNHFARLDERYITLYYGDEVLFRRTANISFNYSYSFDRITIAKTNVSNKFEGLPVNIFTIMENFEKFDISLNIFIYLLMLPLAAIISVVLRNVIGLETFGTFLPILVASVLKGTGVILGVSTFFGIIMIIFLANTLLSRFEILYHPKMAILLSLVISAVIAVFYLGLNIKNYDVIKVVFFPVAIMAITINRVTAVIEEDGPKRFFLVTINTIIVILVSYYFINSIFLQLTMLSFPELILAFVGVNILIGRWAGFRLTEFIRFRQLLARN